jgi:hypothetical protein
MNDPVVAPSRPTTSTARGARTPPQRR